MTFGFFVGPPASRRSSRVSGLAMISSVGLDGVPAGSIEVDTFAFISGILSRGASVDEGKDTSVTCVGKVEINGLLVVFNGNNSDGATGTEAFIGAGIAVGCVKTCGETEGDGGFSCVISEGAGMGTATGSWDTF